MVKGKNATCTIRQKCISEPINKMELEATSLVY